MVTQTPKEKAIGRPKESNIHLRYSNGIGIKTIDLSEHQKALSEQKKEYNKRVFDIQVVLEKSWTDSWNKQIEHLISILNRTHISDKCKLNAVKMSLNAIIKKL